MSNQLQHIRALARKMQKQNELSRKLLLKMGANPAGVKELCDSRNALLNELLNTDPPPEIKKLLEGK